MKTASPRRIRSFLLLAVVGLLIAVLASCTGRGGGQLPPVSPVFTGPASFGFTFSCEQGELRIQLSYTDHGRNPIGSSFSIHGTADVIDPVLESAICIDENPPPGGNELIFLGRYRLTSSAPRGFPSTCPTQESESAPLCRFEVIVRDNDRDLEPSQGDFFSIKLSSATALTSELDPATVFYARAGLLSSGNLTVD